MTASLSPFLTDFDLHLLAEGRHYRTYDKLGAHVREHAGVAGTHFAVWAPNARAVSVIGEFNEWTWGKHPMTLRSAGIWECFIPGIAQGALYKYAITSASSDFKVEKADPHGFASEIRPQTASRVWSIDGYEWGDADWMAKRGAANAIDAPMSVYEVHLGSWMRGENNRWLTYAEMAPKLVAWVTQLGYTHVELLPITEHPFDGSWGYQTVGYFSPTSRFGSPQDLMALIDALHQADIGVILDWVPAHFPRDEHGLGYFDGSHLYEHADPRQGLHQHWGTFIFNYGRREVSNFLISNALFWLEKYHIDGLRVDAVASMLYLDYGRNDGEWIPNRFGGRENLEAIDFLRRFNEQVYEEFPDVVTIAEESTAWPKVSHPTYDSGLGFGLKWNMGWMHDMLRYMAQDPLYRPGVHNSLTFSMMYAYSEKYVLAFSHDEVVHLKKSMLGKMPGDDWQKFANLRLLYGFMTGHPGRKLMFMGGEFGQWSEWDHDGSLQWHLTALPLHAGLTRWVGDLNKLYRSEPAAHKGDSYEWGFKWISCDDDQQSVVAFLRYNEAEDEALAFICNFTPVPRPVYRIGVPWEGEWREVLNSDAPTYGGSGVGNFGGKLADAIPCHAHDFSLSLALPPLGILVLKAPPRPVVVGEEVASSLPPREAGAPAGEEKPPSDGEAKPSGDRGGLVPVKKPKAKNQRPANPPPSA